MAGLPLPDQCLRRDAVESRPAVVLGRVCVETKLCKNARVRSAYSLRTFTFLTEYPFVQYFYFIFFFTVVRMDSQRRFRSCSHASIHVWLIDFNHCHSQVFHISDLANEESHFWLNASWGTKQRNTNLLTSFKIVLMTSWSDGWVMWLAHTVCSQAVLPGLLVYNPQFGWA